ncbi:unnamed protein product [Adineta steineri]|uniref:Uncharacterized protein n=1 Tax=Adineta steineri TaxID=433720 RepID=A0A815RC78_9BILA|nr:unnamed protein product [Adineta steineri]CAF4119923.1 unnamed protein product [Adineta steineri]
MFYLIFLISICPIYINGLTCIDSTSHNIPSGYFDFGKLNKDLLTLKTIDHSDDDPCRLQLFFIGHTNEMTIDFGKRVTASVHLNNEETYLQVLMAFDLEPEEESVGIRPIKVLEHSCSQQNYCDQLFVLRTINAFIEQNNNKTLYQLIMPLLFKKNTKKVQCLNKINGKIGTCTSERCVGIYSDPVKQYEYRCLDGMENGIKLYIDNYFIPDSSDYNRENKKKYNEKQMIKYICNYNQCNNQTISDQIIQIVNQYYDISAIKHLFDYPNQQTTKQEEQQHFSTDIMFTTKQQFSTDVIFTTSPMINTILSTNSFVSSSSSVLMINESTLSTRVDDLSSESPPSFMNEATTSIVNNLTLIYTSSMKSQSTKQFQIGLMHFIAQIIGFIYYKSNNYNE